MEWKDILPAVGFVLAIVVPILGVLIPFLVHVNNSNKEAHKQIGENIKNSKNDINTRINDFKEAMNNRFNDLNKRIDDLNARK